MVFADVGSPLKTQAHVRTTEPAADVGVGCSTDPTEAVTDVTAFIRPELFESDADIAMPLKTEDANDEVEGLFGATIDTIKEATDAREGARTTA